MTRTSGQPDRVTGRTLSRTRLMLARHGETVWHDDNRYAGGLSDIDLTAVGRRQARDLATWSRGQAFNAVVSSPVRRAVETAAPSAAALGMQLQLVEDLREVDFGVAEGRTVEELLDVDPDMVHRFRANPVAHPFPGAESPEAAGHRSAAALRAVADRYPGGRVLVVAHNTVLRLGMCVLLGLPVSRYRQLFPRLDNAAVSQLTVPHDPDESASLLSLNVRVGGDMPRPPTT
jgi:probable phosphoglycerate mutase